MLRRTIIEHFGAWWNRTNSRSRTRKAAFKAGYEAAAVDGARHAADVLAQEALLAAEREEYLANVRTAEYFAEHPTYDTRTDRWVS